MARKQKFTFKDLGNGRVLIKAEQWFGWLRIWGEMELDREHRDKLFDVLTASRARDSRPDA